MKNIIKSGAVAIVTLVVTNSAMAASDVCSGLVSISDVCSGIIQALIDVCSG